MVRAVSKVTAPKTRVAQVSGRRVAGRLMDARPDRMDLRDLPYRPPLRSLPPCFPSDADVQSHFSGYSANRMVLDQGQEGACTGFGLAGVVNYLMWVGAGARAKVPRVSARMLYEMAKRYDEWPGEDYEGSSCRGALKGWHKHGVCAEKLWPHKLDASGKPVFVAPAPDWATDAGARPLGVYYRIDRESVVDMQAAIREVGAIYVSASVHDGWDTLTGKGQGVPTHASLPAIPPPKDPKALGGHAFALVGYNERGFVVQNSWGPGWGLGGFGVMPYDDWVEHGTDAWAVALGVPLALAPSARSVRRGAASAFPMTKGRALTTLERAARNPRNPPDDPWPIDHEYANASYEPWPTAKAYGHTLVSGNDGALCVSELTADPGNPGAYAKRIAFDAPLAAAQKRKVLKLMVYAHGGLNSEAESIERIRVLAPYFEANGIYPLFLTWKTGPGETLCDIVQDWARKVFGAEALAGDAADALGEARDRAVEAVAHVLGRGLWSEMRENAELGAQSTHVLDLLARNLYSLAAELKDQRKALQLHFVGHSAGSILLGHLLTRMRQPDLVNPKLLRIESCALYAAACSVRFAVQHYLPADQDILDTARMSLYVLSDANEKADGLPKPDAPAYGKSLLYLVSRALDDRRKMPLLGMERALAVAYAKDSDQWAAEELGEVQAWQRGSRHREVVVSDRNVVVGKDGRTIPATHGSFDNNIAVVGETIRRIADVSTIAPVEWLDY
jgi:hypothetical protein